MPPETFSPEEVVQTILDFENLIREQRNGSGFPSGSPIENVGLTAIEMLEKFRGGIPHDFEKDTSETWRQAIALCDMLRRVKRLAGHPSFGELWQHLLLLLEDTNVALSVKNSVLDAKNNKILELYVALIVAPLCRDLLLDDPIYSSGGRNPDVIATLDGSTWAFACKVLHSDKPTTFVGQLRKGISQIQDSDADKGIVVISLKNLLPHDEFWNIQRPQSFADFMIPGLVDFEIVKRHIERISQEYHQQVINDLLGGPEGFNALFDGQKAMPAVLLHFSTTLFFKNEEQPNFHYLRAFALMSAGPLPGEVWVTLEKVNLSLHNRFEELEQINALS